MMIASRAVMVSASKATKVTNVSKISSVTRAFRAIKTIALRAKMETIVLRLLGGPKKWRGCPGNGDGLG